MDAYNAGLLNDFGGGDVQWWHTYIRTELARAHDFYVDQFTEIKELERRIGELEGKLAEARELLVEVSRAYVPIRWYSFDQRNMEDTHPYYDPCTVKEFHLTTFLKIFRWLGWKVPQPVEEAK